MGLVRHQRTAAVPQHSASMMTHMRLLQPSRRAVRGRQLCRHLETESGAAVQDTGWADLESMESVNSAVTSQCPHGSEAVSKRWLRGRTRSMRRERSGKASSTSRSCAVGMSSTSPLPARHTHFLNLSPRQHGGCMSACAAVVWGSESGGLGRACSPDVGVSQIRLE